MGRTLGLIAGSGRLPFEVLAAARDRGLRVAVVAITDNAEPELEAAVEGPLLWNPAGQLARTIAFLKESRADEVILAGGVAKREAVRDRVAFEFDERALALLARLSRHGDDALLRAIAEDLESEGLPVVASTRYLQDRLTREGLLSGRAPDPRTESDLRIGLRVARALGAEDVGQSVVVKEGTVLAVEAIEGTDATIRRAAELGGGGAVAVKAAKPDQDLRFDVPTIGPSTVEVAVACELRAIGLEAGRTLVLDQDRTLDAAQRHGLTVLGMTLDLP